MLIDEARIDEVEPGYVGASLLLRGTDDETPPTVLAEADREPELGRRRPSAVYSLTTPRTGAVRSSTTRAVRPIDERLGHRNGYQKTVLPSLPDRQDPATYPGFRP